VRSAARWQCWVVVASMALAFWAQDGMAFAASQQAGSVGSGLSRLFDWLGGGGGSGPGSKMYYLEWASF
jgi:hypothetical protein